MPRLGGLVSAASLCCSSPQSAIFDSTRCTSMVQKCLTAPPLRRRRVSLRPHSQVMIPASPSQPMRVLRGPQVKDKNDDEFLDGIKQEFHQKHTDVVIDKDALMAHLSGESKIDTSDLMATAAKTVPKLRIIPLAFAAPESDYLGVQMYVDENAGEVGLKENGRAGGIAAICGCPRESIRGDVFISRVFSDGHHWWRENFEIPDIRPSAEWIQTAHKVKARLEEEAKAAMENAADPLADLPEGYYDLEAVDDSDDEDDKEPAKADGHSAATKQPAAPVVKRPEDMGALDSNTYRDNYRFRQMKGKVTVAIEVEDDIWDEDVRVTIKPNHLTVRIKGAEGLDGELSGKVEPRKSSWELDDGEVKITLQKACISDPEDEDRTWFDWWGDLWAKKM